MCLSPCCSFRLHASRSVCLGSLAMILETPQTIKTKHCRVKMKTNFLPKMSSEPYFPELFLKFKTKFPNEQPCWFGLNFAGPMAKEWHSSSRMQPVSYYVVVEGAVFFGQACKAGKRHVASWQTTSLWLVDHSCLVANFFVCILIVILNCGFCFLTFYLISLLFVLLPAGFWVSCFLTLVADRILGESSVIKKIKKSFKM